MLITTELPKTFNHYDFCDVFYNIIDKGETIGGKEFPYTDCCETNLRKEFSTKLFNPNSIEYIHIYEREKSLLAYIKPECINKMHLVARLMEIILTNLNKDIEESCFYATEDYKRSYGFPHDGGNLELKKVKIKYLEDDGRFLITYNSKISLFKLKERE